MIDWSLNNCSCSVRYEYEVWTVEDVEGGSRGLYEGTIPEFPTRDAWIP